MESPTLGCDAPVDPMVLLLSAMTAIAMLIAHRWQARRLDRWARTHERSRIARELHDTLLQSSQALIFELQSIAARMPDDDSHRAALARAIDAAERALAEARDRVLGLRGRQDTSGDLGRSLAAALQSSQGAPLPRVRTLLSGLPRHLEPKALDAVLRIGLEAVRNALRHARASTIEVCVDFGPDALQLRVRDDGVGLVQPARPSTAAMGRCGLHGMSEQAGEIGGRLTVGRPPEGGTELLLVVPARAAYARDGDRVRDPATVVESQPC